MIFPFQYEQVRINTYYFRLMLVLVIPEIETSVFVFNLRLHIAHDVTRLFANKLCF